MAARKEKVYCYRCGLSPKFKVKKTTRAERARPVGWLAKVCGCENKTCMMYVCSKCANISENWYKCGWR